MMLPFLSTILILADLSCSSRGFIIEISDSDALKPDLLQLAQSLNLTACVSQLKSAGIERIINHEGPFTIFCPIDDAFSRQVVYPGSAKMQDKMLQHCGKGLITSDMFTNELIVNSLLKGRSIRVNVYTAGPFSTETVNGQAVIESDHMARNGVIHIIYSVMESVYPSPGSVIGELGMCCDGTTQLLAFIRLAGLFQVLDNTEPITLLAPSDSAWAKLGSAFLNHLDKDINLLRRVILSHVLQGTWYSVGLSRGDTIKTLSGYKVKIEKDKNGVVSFSGARSTLSDVAARNGAVYVVDEVIIPKEIFKGRNF